MNKISFIQNKIRIKSCNKFNAWIISCPLLERYLADLALALSPCVTPMCVELMLANSGRFFGFQAFYYL